MLNGIRRAAAGLLRAAAAGIAPAYPSTGTGRRSSRLRLVGSPGPNATVSGNAGVLRPQARQAVRSNGIAGRGIDLLVTHIVGTGIKPQSLCPDAGFREQFARLWYDWTAVADADGVLDFYGLQALAVREWLEGGDAFARLRPRRLADGLPVPLQLQLVEAEQLPHDYTTTAPATGNAVIQGIERDAIGRRVGYWFWNQHPSDWPTQEIGTGQQLIRVDAADVLHLYHPTRAGQLRGLPHLASILVALNEVEEYQDAERVRHNYAARKLAMMTLPPETDDGESQVGETPADSGGTAELSMEPGTMMVVDAGTDIKWMDPAEAGGTYETFLRWQYRTVAAAANVLYEELTGDYSQINDRTYRAAFNTFKRRAGGWQHNIVAVQFCAPVVARFIQLALMSGALQRPAGITDRDLYRVAWTPDRWPYINPLQDIQALSLEIETGLTSRSAQVSERGDDVEEIDRQRAADQERAQRLGLTPPPVPALVTPAADRKVNAPPDAGGAPSSGPPAAATAPDLRAHNPHHDEHGRFATADGGGRALRKQVRRVRKAVATAIDRRADAPHAVQRRDLGAIDLLWGKSGTLDPRKGRYVGGAGLAHVISQRDHEGADGRAVARKLADVLVRAPKSTWYGPAGARRMNLSYDGHTAVVAERHDAPGRLMLLTGWKDK